MAYVQKRIVEDASGRKLLHAQFLHSQRFSQDDPWAERAAGVDASEFNSMAVLA